VVEPPTDAAFRPHRNCLRLVRVSSDLVLEPLSSCTPATSRRQFGHPWQHPVLGTSKPLLDPSTAVHTLALYTLPSCGRFCYCLGDESRTRGSLSMRSRPGKSISAPMPRPRTWLNRHLGITHRLCSPPSLACNSRLRRLPCVFVSRSGAAAALQEMRPLESVNASASSFPCGRPALFGSDLSLRDRSTMVEESTSPTELILVPTSMAATGISLRMAGNGSYGAVYLKEPSVVFSGFPHPPSRCSARCR